MRRPISLGPESGNTLKVHTYNATDIAFVAGLIGVREEGIDVPRLEGQATGAEKTRSIIAELSRASHSVGALAVIESVDAEGRPAQPRPVAYAYCLNTYRTPRFSVHLADIGVAPDARGLGLSAVTTQEVLRTFRPNQEMIDPEGLGVVNLLLGHLFEADTSSNATTSPPEVVNLSRQHTVGDVIGAIGRAFPEPPAYQVVPHPLDF